VLYKVPDSGGSNGIGGGGWNADADEAEAGVATAGEYSRQHWRNLNQSRVQMAARTSQGGSNSEGTNRPRISGSAPKGN